MERARARSISEVGNAGAFREAIRPGSQENTSINEGRTRLSGLRRLGIGTAAALMVAGAIVASPARANADDTVPPLPASIATLGSANLGCQGQSCASGIFPSGSPTYGTAGNGYYNYSLMAGAAFSAPGNSGQAENYRQFNVYVAYQSSAVSSSNQSNQGGMAALQSTQATLQQQLQSDQSQGAPAAGAAASVSASIQAIQIATGTIQAAITYNTNTFPQSTQPTGNTGTGTTTTTIPVSGNAGVGSGATSTTVPTNPGPANPSSGSSGPASSGSSGSGSTQAGGSGGTSVQSQGNGNPSTSITVSPSTASGSLGFDNNSNSTLIVPGISIYSTGPADTILNLTISVANQQPGVSVNVSGSPYTLTTSSDDSTTISSTKPVIISGQQVNLSTSTTVQGLNASSSITVSKGQSSASVEGSVSPTNPVIVAKMGVSATSSGVTISLQDEVPKPSEDEAKVATVVAIATVAAIAVAVAPEASEVTIPAAIKAAQAVLTGG